MYNLIAGCIAKNGAESKFLFQSPVVNYQLHKFAPSRLRAWQISIIQLLGHFMRFALLRYGRRAMSFSCDL